MEKVPLLREDRKETSIRINADDSSSRHDDNVSHALFGYMLMACAACTKASRAFIFHVSERVYHFPASVNLALTAIVFILGAGLFVAFTGVHRSVPKTRTLLLMLTARGLLTALTLYLNNIALARVPVGVSLTIFSCAPVLTSVLAALLLNDPLRSTDIAVLTVNAVGVVLVAQPTNPGIHVDAITGALAAMGAATTGSLAVILVKKLGTRVHFMVNMLSIGVGCTIVSGLTTSREQVQMLFIDVHHTLVPVLGAVVGFVSQALVNRSVQLCRPGPALVIRSLAVPISFTLGFLFLAETVSFFTVVGVFLVLGSVLYIGLSQVVRNGRRETRRSNSAPIGT